MSARLAEAIVTIASAGRGATTVRVDGAQLVIGPELRAEHVGDGVNPGRAIASLPLVIEGNFLAAGD